VPDEALVNPVLLGGAAKAQIEECITIRDAADALKVSTDFVRNLIRDGRLVGYKLGPSRTAPVRILASSVRGLLDDTEIIRLARSSGPGRRAGRRPSSDAKAWGL
jgi:excisionase family DNA binding protein